MGSIRFWFVWKYLHIHSITMVLPLCSLSVFHRTRPHQLHKVWETCFFLLTNGGDGKLKCIKSRFNAVNICNRRHWDTKTNEPNIREQDIFGWLNMRCAKFTGHLVEFVLRAAYLEFGIKNRVYPILCDIFTKLITPDSTSFSYSCSSNSNSLEPALCRFISYLIHLHFFLSRRVASHHLFVGLPPPSRLCLLFTPIPYNKYISVANIYSSHSKRKLCKIHFTKKWNFVRKRSRSRKETEEKRIRQALMPVNGHRKKRNIEYRV